MAQTGIIVNYTSGLLKTFSTVMLSGSSGGGGSTTPTTSDSKIRDVMETVVTQNMTNARLSGRNLDMSVINPEAPVTENIVPQLQELLSGLISEGLTAKLEYNGVTCTSPSQILSFILNITGEENPTEDDITGLPISLTVKEDSITNEYVICISPDYNSLLQRVIALENTDFTSEDVPDDFFHTHE